MGNSYKTVKYVDLFDYPLTRDELVKWQFNQKVKSSQQEIGDLFEKELHELIDNELIDICGEYYFIKGRDDIIRIRKEREKVSLEKIKKAQRMAKILGMIPNVKMICVVSNLGYLNAEAEADIDLFIVTSAGKIWGVRFWSVMIMKFLGKRPTKKSVRDKICLSYFVDQNNLNLESTKISEPDMHLIYLVSQCLPIYAEDDMWQKYIEANKWIAKYLPNFNYTERDKQFIVKLKNRWLKNLIAKTELGFEERFYKQIQLRRMAAELRKAWKRGNKKVIINDSMLKLHINDKRDEINKMIN